MLDKAKAFYNANKTLVWVAVGTVVILATGLHKSVLALFKK